MRIRILLVVVVLAALFSCVYTWKGVPKDVPIHDICDSSAAFPQMLEIPVFSKAWQVVHSCDKHPREPTSVAMLVFYTKWDETFGDYNGDIWGALNKLMVAWSPSSKRGDAYDIDGNPVKDVSFGGVALSPSYIWVKVYPDRLICESSFVHELVHIAIWTIKGSNGDPDHAGPKYRGWSVDHSKFIEDVNDELCTLGI